MSSGLETGPSPELIDGGTQLEPPVRQAVLDAGWNLRVSRSSYGAVAFEFPQLLDEHLLGDSGDSALQMREPHHGADAQVNEDAQLPTPLDDLEGLLGLTEFLFGGEVCST